jgi:hypothetical protein
MLPNILNEVFCYIQAPYTYSKRSWEVATIQIQKKGQERERGKCKKFVNEYNNNWVHICIDSHIGPSFRPHYLWFFCNSILITLFMLPFFGCALGSVWVIEQKNIYEVWELEHGNHIMTTKISLLHTFPPLHWYINDRKHINIYEDLSMITINGR